MNKEEFTSVLQAMLLLYDDMPEEEVRRLVGDKHIGCAKGLMGFVKTYKLPK